VANEELTMRGYLASGELKGEKFGQFEQLIIGQTTVDALVLSGVQTIADQGAMVRREAQDIYNRARKAWAHGQGKFLLGVTHFMVMNDVYMKAEENGLEIDEAGLQLLLRGALEYDHEIDYWWNKLDKDNRRWVALHTIRSESAPACDDLHIAWIAHVTDQSA